MTENSTFGMVSTNLPVQLTNFIGRERELASVESMLSTTRLVTLTGVGGCGKTRLAIEVANKVSQSFSDGVWFVGLASLRDTTLIPQFIVEALGLRLTANQPLLEALKSHLQSRQLLLVLDNCEHLSVACAELVQQLLSHAPELRILATGREPLAVVGEAVYPVAGLDWPSLREVVQQSRVPIQGLLAFSAVKLFVERARAIS